jgi:hypothetical protein
MGSAAGRLKNAHSEDREGATARGPSAAARRRPGSGDDGWGGVLPLGCDGGVKAAAKKGGARLPHKKIPEMPNINLTGRGRSAGRKWAQSSPVKHGIHRIESINRGWPESL